MTERAVRQPALRLPDGIKVFVTTRECGHSKGDWSSFNLAEHVQDHPAAVLANRALLKTRLLSVTGSPTLDFQWLNQVHGTSVHHAVPTTALFAPQADAVYTSTRDLVCGVLTADCLPVVFYSADGREIGVAHAGWRGLQNGVLENTLRHFQTPPAQISAWLGPAIGACHFEVGDEVREAFLGVATPATAAATEAAFTHSVRAGKWFADLYQLARVRLHAAGLVSVEGKTDCTVCNSAVWYSYRQNPVTGRFATLIVKTIQTF